MRTHAHRLATKPLRPLSASTSPLNMPHQRFSSPPPFILPSLLRHKVVPPRLSLWHLPYLGSHSHGREVLGPCPLPSGTFGGRVHFLDGGLLSPLDCPWLPFGSPSIKGTRPKVANSSSQSWEFLWGRKGPFSGASGRGRARTTLLTVAPGKGRDGVPLEVHVLPVPEGCKASNLWQQVYYYSQTWELTKRWSPTVSKNSLQVNC